MAEKAGRADKLGNTYEALWSCDVAIRLLKGDYQSIEFEPQVDSAGIEFIVLKPNGEKQYHSTKIKSSASWAIGDLSKVNANRTHAVLLDLFKKHIAEPDSETIFITTASSKGLIELEKLAKRTQDVDQFHLTLNKDEKEIFNILLTNLNTRPDELIRFLGKFRYITIDRRTLEEKVSNDAHTCIVRMNQQPFEIHEFLGIFWDIREKYFGQKLDKENLLLELRSKGYELADWNVRPGIKDKIALWNENFRKDNGGYGKVLEHAIPRNEAEELFRLIQEEQDMRVYSLTGVPAIGKSGVFVQLQKKIEDAGIPVIAISFKHGTKEYESLRNELSGNPESVLAGIAKEKKSVLILDGIDSIGQLSGSYPEDWNFFTNLVSKILKFSNNVVLVLGCRKFDYDNDDSIRRVQTEYKSKEVKCDLLPLSSVEDILRKYKITQSLSLRQKDLLRTPFFLRLFLEGDRHLQIEYSNPEDIFSDYWASIEKKLSSKGLLSLDSVFEQAVKDLLVSGKYLFKRNPISNLKTIETLIIEGILVEAVDQLSFLHPLMQDYAIGRYFVSKKIKINTYLKSISENQKLQFGLKARSIIAIYRSKLDTSDFYFSQLKDCIFDKSIPLFIKAHILDWFGNLKDPSAAEWNFISPYLSMECWEFIDTTKKKTTVSKILFFIKRQSIRLKVFRNVYLSSEKTSFILRTINRIPFQADSWFSLAESKSFWVKLKENETIPETINFAKHLRSSNSTLLKSNILSEYIRIWSNQQGKQEAILLLLEFAKLEHSIDLQKVIEYLIDEGFFDSYGGIGRFHFLFSESLPEKFRIEILSRALERSLQLCESGSEHFLKEDRESNIFPNLHEFENILRNEYVFYAEKFFPIFRKLIAKSKKEDLGGLEADLIWPYFFLNGDSMYVKDQFLQNLIRSFIHLAIHEPEDLHNLIGDTYQSKSRTIIYLLFQSLSQNPSFFFDKLFQMIEKDPIVLLVGDSGVMTLQSGNFYLLPPKKVIKAIYPHLTNEQRSRLEIILFSLPIKADQFYLLLVLLDGVPSEYRSKQLDRKIAELQRRYPEFDLKPVVIGSSFASIVGSPIEDVALEKMTDRQWIRAMKKYNSTYQPRTRDYLKGDGMQLSFALQNKAEKDPNRFVKLLLATNEEIDSFYYSHVLLGISKVWKGKVEFDLVLKLIEKSHNLTGNPCLREISSLVSDLADEELPDSMLEIIRQYAAIGKDPFERKSTADKIPDYLQIGINSDRGSIAWTIGELISKESRRYQFFMKTIEDLVQDPNAPVRACAMIPVLYILNYDKSKAVELFLKLLDGHSDLSGLQNAQAFLGYAIHSHYEDLRETLLKMTQHEIDKIQKIGSSIITFASFENSLALEDFYKLNWKHLNIRRGIVEVVSETISNSNSNYQDRSLKILSLFFKDEDENIRFKISHCIEKLKDDFFIQEEEWLIHFIREFVFMTEHSRFLKRIIKLPKISDKLAIVIGESALDAYLLKSNLSLYYETDLVDILIVAYHQTKNQRIKANLFNILDSTLLWNQRHFLNKLEIENF